MAVVVHTSVRSFGLGACGSRGATSLVVVPVVVMSGQEPTRARPKTLTKCRAGSRAEEAERAPLRPLILIPSPADLAAGRRVIVVEEDEIPRSVRAFRDATIAGGWSAQVTYSHFWDVPPATGRWAGRWVPKHMMCVRFWHLGRRLRGYATWVCSDDGSGAARWSSDGGQVQIIGQWPSGELGIRQIERLIAGEVDLKWGPVRVETDKKGRAMIHYGYSLG